MGTAQFPVDLLNLGQVLAALGFLEAAEALCGRAEGGFAWDDRNDQRATYTLSADGEDNPVETVLSYLATTPVTERRPDDGDESNEAPGATISDMAQPIELGGGNLPAVRLGHWADGSSRDDFKLYSGNRSAFSIARTMLTGSVTARGKIDLMGIAQIWSRRREEVLADPLGLTVPMGGSFNFDARCAWSPIDAGYSPNSQSQRVMGSPVVEMLAAWGLEHARPYRVEGRRYRYAAWQGSLPPMLARPALAGSLEGFPARRFGLTLALSGKNKIVVYAEEEV